MDWCAHSGEGGKGNQNFKNGGDELVMRRTEFLEHFKTPFWVTDIIRIIRTGSYEEYEPKICNRKCVLSYLCPQFSVRMLLSDF